MIVFFLAKKFKTYLVFLLLGVIFVSGMIIFYDIPCYVATNKTIAPITSSLPKTNPENHPAAGGSAVSPPASLTPLPTLTPTPASTPVPPSVTISKKSVKKIITLSGRVNGIWQESFGLFLTAPVFGLGFQADRFFLAGQHAHSTLLHALIQTGLVGTIPFVLAYLLTLIMIYKLFRSNRISQQQKIFLIEITGVLVFLIVRGIAESLAFYSADWIFVAPIIGYVQILYFNSENSKT